MPMIPSAVFARSELCVFAVQAIFGMVCVRHFLLAVVLGVSFASPSTKPTCSVGRLRLKLVTFWQATTASITTLPGVILLTKRGCHVRFQRPKRSPRMTFCLHEFSTSSAELRYDSGWDEESNDFVPRSLSKLLCGIFTDSINASISDGQVTVEPRSCSCFEPSAKS